MATKPRKSSTESLGPTIERLMTDTGLTYRALADKTNLSAGYLNHIVHGNRPVPSNEVLARLAKALGCRLEELFWLEEDRAILQAVPTRAVAAVPAEVRREQAAYVHPGHPVPVLEH